MSDEPQSPEPAGEQAPPDQPAALEPDAAAESTDAVASGGQPTVVHQTPSESQPTVVHDSPVDESDASQSQAEGAQAPAPSPQPPAEESSESVVPSDIEPAPEPPAAPPVSSPASEPLPPPPPPPTPDWAPTQSASPLAGRPELVVGAAFAGGLVLALILKRLAR